MHTHKKTRNTRRLIAFVAGFLATMLGAVVVLTPLGATAIDMVTSPEIKDGAVHRPDLAPNVNNGIDKSRVYRSTLAAPVTIENIGGPITDNFTDTGIAKTLPAGKYLFKLSGAFSSGTAATDPTVDIYPQLSLWLDFDNDGAFEWQDGEGANLSPNAIMPTAADRHITVDGQAVVKLDAETVVKVLAFGYAADQSSKRSGEIDVATATLTAEPIR